MEASPQKFSVSDINSRLMSLSWIKQTFSSLILDSVETSTLESREPFPRSCNTFQRKGTVVADVEEEKERTRSLKA